MHHYILYNKYTKDDIIKTIILLKNYNRIISTNSYIKVKDIFIISVKTFDDKYILYVPVNAFLDNPSIYNFPDIILYLMDDWIIREFFPTYSIHIRIMKYLNLMG